MRAARDLLLSLLTAATVLLAVGSWSRIATGMSHAMLPITLTAAVVLGAGVAMRSVGAPRWAVAVVQLALAWCVVSIRLTYTPVPLPYAPRMRLENAFVASGDAILHAAPPAPVAGGVLAIVLCGAGLAFVLADVVARTLGRPAVAGLVLLAVLAVPISVAATQMHLTGAARAGVDPWLFALVALGWLAQLVLAEGDRLARWGQDVDTDDSGRGSVPAPASRSLLGSLAVGGTATALALVVPLAIPTAQVDFSGFGGGAGDGHVTVTNPLVDVRRNLQQGADIPLVTVTTPDPNPSYLRLAVLTRFTSTQWSAGDRSIPQDQTAHGSVPIAGLSSDVRGLQFRYRISVATTFESRWLPTPAPITEIEAGGDWRYDVQTDDFLAATRGLNTAGISYSATRLQARLTASELDKSEVGIGQLPASDTEVPDDLPKIVGQEAKQVTRDASTPFEEAVALQDWFRTTGDFTYSTSTDLGSGSTDLGTFLGTGEGSRTGYCQQFAAAMAAMARTLGIPARVAVGFLTPSKGPGETYVYSSHDMHAWPELYFEGVGWIRFEPTPTTGTDVPTYAHDPAGPTTSPTTAPSTDASTGPRVRSNAKPKPDAAEDDEQGTADRGDGDHHVIGWIVGVLILALLLALAALPREVRRRRRRTRLRGSAEDAWAEVRDTAIDLGIPWADGVSPRATRQPLGRYLGTHEGHVALDRLVDALERERYAASHEPLDPQVPAELIDGLERGAAPAAVRRAAWLPRSVLRSGPVTMTDRSLDRVG